MIDRGKHNLLGVGIDAVDYAGAVERIVVAARSNARWRSLHWPFMA